MRAVTWFRTELSRGDETACVEVRGGAVSVTTPDGTTQTRDYEPGLHVAGCVFEANVLGWEGRGYSVVRQAGDAGQPGCLDVFGDGGELDDELSWVRWNAGRVVAAGIDGADPQATYDGTKRSLEQVPSLLDFDRRDPDPLGEVTHAMRRLAWHPLAEAAEVSLCIGLAHDRLLDCAIASGVAAMTVDLLVRWYQRDRHPPSARRLERTFPILRSLALPWFAVDHLLGERHDGLRHVSLMSGLDTPAPDSWVEVFDRVAHRAPRLRSLMHAEASVFPAALDALLSHTIAGQLEAIDIVATSYKPDLDRLLAAQATLPNLRDVFITDHVLSPEERQRVSVWPAVVCVGYKHDAPRYREHWARIRPQPARA